MLSQSVTIDGKWTTSSEWTDAPEIQMTVARGTGLGYFRVKHDATHLYILGESLVDTAVEYNSTAEMGDWISIFLDTQYNQGTSPQTDDYRAFGGYVNASYSEVRTWNGNGTAWVRIGSMVGMQVMVGLDTANSPHTPHPHVTAESKIPLSVIPVATFGFFIRLDDSMLWWSDSSYAETMHFYWPGPVVAVQGTNPSNWGVLTLSATPVPEFTNTLPILLTGIAAVTAFSRLQKKK